tara:strand:+ start:491 stop:787 length:297 start_codon:yes stop_codon:yes gene_type:complete
MKTKKELNSVYNLVNNLLTIDERCRNDDKWLTYRVMRYYTPIFIPFNDFAKIPAFETIKRCRAKIQNTEKRLIPTDIKTLKKRRLRSEDIRSWAVDGR